MTRQRVSRTWPAVFLLGTALSCTDLTSSPGLPQLSTGGPADGGPPAGTVDAPKNLHPIAKAGGPYRGTAGLPIAFDGSGSRDLDGNSSLTYEWSFGDDSGTATGGTPTHVYATAGTYI